MFFLIFPIIAHIAFMLFGQRYKYRTTLEAYHHKPTFAYEKTNENDYGKMNPYVKSLFETESNMTKRGVYAANVQVFDKGDVSFDELFKDLQKAKKFIHLQYYIIKPGEIYEQLREVLIEKAKEGVEIRFIVDDFGRWALPWYEIKELENHGIKFGKFGKIRFPFISSYNTYRMHRKMAIIDGEVLYTGGMNIADEYANMSKKYGIWMDYQTRITGPAVISHSLLFIDDWKEVSGEDLDIPKYIKDSKEVGNSKMVLVEDSPETLEPIIQRTWVKMILKARKYIRITTPYFIPTPELNEALKTAALSGVKVEIVIPGKPDKKTALIATKYWAKELLRYGVKVYQMPNTLLHSKLGVFDGEYAYFGTANMDVRSLFGQWETMNVVYGTAVKQIDNVISSYIKISKSLKIEEFSKRWIKDKAVRFYANLFSPIM